MTVVITYHIPKWPYTEGSAEVRVCELHRVPGVFEPPAGAIVDRVELIEP